MPPTTNHPAPAASFTGRRRGKRTHWSVRLGDVVSRGLITVGGIGTILAVSTVFIFLVWVATPLFFRADTRPAGRLPLPPSAVASAPRFLGVDEYRTLAWTFHPDGALRSFHLQTGRPMAEIPPGAAGAPTSVSFGADNAEVALGFADGSIRLGRIGFGGGFVKLDDLPESLRGLRPGATVEWEGGLLEVISPTHARTRKLTADFRDPLRIAETPILLLDHNPVSGGYALAALTEAGELLYERVTERRNLMTGQVTLRKQERRLPYTPRPNAPPPEFLALSGLGDSVLLAWKDGYAVRYNTRDADQASIEEEVDLTPEPGVELTALRYLLGDFTLLTGDSTGRARAWFPVLVPGAGARTTLTPAHVFPASGAPIRALAASARMRLFAAGDEQGGVRLFHVTSHKLLAELTLGRAGAAEALAFAPKDDGLLALGGGTIESWSLDPRHPEITPAALFRPVWYEGAAHHAHVWQSSSGTDDFEPKFGLMPLIFGTLKATFYSLLFGLPIALFGAVFTSEFLPPRAKSVIKPTVELMASLPSVVLGFLAALVFAPFVEKILPAALLSFYTLPAAFLFGATLWQLLPDRIRLRWAPWRLLFVALAIPIGLGAAAGLGPWAERLLFAGDIRRWLDGQHGGAFGGWFLILLPLTALVLGGVLSAWLAPRLRVWSAAWSRARCAVFDLGRWLALAGVILAANGGLAALLAGLGFDPRGPLVGTYVQRNALVVGFVMGFAIIPIIYTIADDALTAVPEHLRSASLAAGATPWQTAMRVIVPTAMSGLFSAVMIGLGRAVGETMIVLMAAGNTPVMEWNIFNGFRTLSANIAVELPEAVRNSTHYRTLFLAALALFVMTFAVNTAAEIIRLRFRRKAVEL